MTVQTRERLSFALVLSLGFLVFFAQTKDFKLLVDGLTYVGLAKNILRTGDWKTLHYSVEQYRDFYQHPPLAIWIQAIIFKIFGFSEAISRLLPSFCALFSLAAVYRFVLSRAGLSAALFASLTLVTSTRFVKWGTNFYLDGIFACFCLLGLLSWLNSIHFKDKRVLFGLFSGVFFAAAFMTKGVIVAGALGAVGLSLFFFPTLLTLQSFLFLILGAIIPLLIWGGFAGGLPYIQHYLAESVFSRVHPNTLNFSPWINLLKIWWPWLPVFVWSLFKFEKERILIALVALSFPLGFMFGEGYLEHYLTPFYPFAVILVGIQMGQWFPKLSDRALQISCGMVFVGALYLATLSPNVNKIKETPVQEWMHQLNLLPKETQQSFTQIAFTGKSADIWYGLANIIGLTDWQAIGNFDPSRPSVPRTILIVTPDQKSDSSWQLAPCLQVRGFLFYQSPDLKVCTQ